MRTVEVPSLWKSENKRPWKCFSAVLRKLFLCGPCGWVGPFVKPVLMVEEQHKGSYNKMWGALLVCIFKWLYYLLFPAWKKSLQEHAHMVNAQLFIGHIIWKNLIIALYQFKNTSNKFNQWIVIIFWGAVSQILFSKFEKLSSRISLHTKNYKIPKIVGYFVYKFFSFLPFYFILFRHCHYFIKTF